MSTNKRPSNHGDRETRYRKACERLSTDKPCCILGDETSPLAIELHHIAGRKFDDDLVPLCLNHHARASDWQKDHPAKIADCVNPLEAIGHFLLGIGDLVVIAIEDRSADPLWDLLQYLRLKLQEFGTRLIEMARALPSETFGNAS